MERSNVVKKVNSNTLKSLYDVGVLIESKCAGKDCTRRAVRILQIKFLHKKGAFCDRCASELHALDLIENFSDNRCFLVKKNNV